MIVPFAKMHGCGNDFVVINEFETPRIKSAEIPAVSKGKTLIKEKIDVPGFGVFLITVNTVVPARRM